MSKGPGQGVAIAFVAGVILLAASRCGQADKPAPAPAPTKTHGVSDWERTNRAQAEVRKLLRDPGSATFSDVRVSTAGGQPVVCGYVNSKNGFGGMTGPQRFVWHGITAIEEQVGKKGMDEVWAQVC